MPPRCPLGIDTAGDSSTEASGGRRSSGDDISDDNQEPAPFETSRQTLNMNLGGIDTLILLTSSWCVALAVQALKRDHVDRVPRYLLGGSAYRADVHDVEVD